MGKVRRFNSLSGLNTVSEDAISQDQLRDYTAVMLAPILKDLARNENMLTRLLQFLASDGMEVWKGRQFDANGVPYGGTFVGNTWLDVEKFSEFTKTTAQQEAEQEAANAVRG